MSATSLAPAPVVTGRVFFVLVCLTLLTPFIGAPSWLYPWLTLKAYYLAILLDATLPFYLYLVVKYPDRRPSLGNPLTASILLFWTCAAISNFLGISPLRSFLGTMERPGAFHLAHLLLFYFYLQLLNSLDPSYLRRFFQLFAITGGLSALYGVLEVATRNHFSTPDPAYPYISATFGNPIFFAGYLIVPAFISLFFAVQGRSWRTQAGFGGLAALQVLCIALTQKKGAAVAMAVTFWLIFLLIGFLWTGRPALKYARVAALAFPVLAALAGLVAAKERSSLSTQVGPSAFVRFQIWRDALSAAKEYPVFGTGAENFYVIENKHYRPEVYRYETGWVDKPHNILLEVLATNGTIGLLSFAGILICSALILRRVYLADSASRLPVVMLGAALLAYELQDLFAFDTISESLALYSLLGLIGTMWTAPTRLRAAGNPHRGLIAAAAGAVVAIIFCAANIKGLQYYRNVSRGSFYSNLFEAGKAEDYLESARSSPFQFDSVELGAQYHMFASRVASMPGGPDPANRIVSRAIIAGEEAVRRFPENAAAWLALADLYLIRDRLEPGTGALDRARHAMGVGSRLAPNRLEVPLMQVRFSLHQNDFDGARLLVHDILGKFPTCGEAYMQSATLARLTGGNEDQAAQAAWMAMLNGYTPLNRAEVAWLGVYHTKRQNWLLASQIYERMIRIGPRNPDDMWQLAQLYGKTGRISDAGTAAQALLTIDPQREAAVRAFTESLKDQRSIPPSGFQQ